MQHIINQLAAKQKDIQSNSATLGFDGFIDSIVKLVKHTDSAGRPLDYFNSADSWGRHILDKKGGNFSVQLTQTSIKPGGNAPNMAHALAKLGLSVNCVGALGYPVIDPIFDQSLPQSRFYSYAAPGTCQAIEFKEGKMMLANMDELNKASWSLLKSRISLDKLITLFDTASLVGLLNWGELSASTDFWKGLLTDILPFCSKKNKMFFVDLSDCSGRSKEEVFAALDLLTHFSSHGTVALSLNQPEAIFIHTVLAGPVADTKDLAGLGKNILAHINPAILLLHNQWEAVAYCDNIFVQKNSCTIEEPALLTGAGDNFNAGFCFARLMGLNLEDSLSVAHLTAACYIKNGESPRWDVLINALQTFYI